VHRDTVHATLRRWRDACFAGLDDRPHARRRRALKIDLRAMATVRQLQENPALGEFRVHAALKQLGIELSPRTCGRILALNRQLYGLGTPRQGQAARALKAMPFRARRRHQYWSVDVRYLDHRLGGGDVYAISILENYSRAILASGLFRTQDTAASLLVLRAAVARYGSPDALVSDGGGIFRATQARAIYAALGITKERIDPGEPWQSYVETTFNIQRRMADWHVAQATSWPELLAAHDRWLTDDNAQPHWAHQDRPGGRRSPLEVLGWVTGTVHDAAALERVFGRSRFGRRLDLGGYARFRRWRIYGERGLAKQPAAVWLSGEYLTVAFADEPLAQYVVRVGAGAKELHKVTVLQLFETRHGSPQPFLWELGPDEWLTAIRLPPRPYRRRRGTTAIQEQLLPTAGAEQAR